MAAETGNTYIFETRRDSIEIPTANLGFTPTQDSKKCRQVIATSTENSDMAYKTGNNYISGATSDSVEIPTANPHFR